MLTLAQGVNPEDNWTDRANVIFGEHGELFAVLALIAAVFVLALVVWAYDFLMTSDFVATWVGALGACALLVLVWVYSRLVGLGLRAIEGGAWFILVLAPAGVAAFLLWARSRGRVVDSFVRVIDLALMGLILVVSVWAVVDDYLKELAGGLGISVMALLILAAAVLAFAGANNRR